MKSTKNDTSKVTLGKFIRALFKKETPYYIKGIIGLAIAYTIFPIDFLPDIFGFLGFADDAAVIGALTTFAMALLDNFYDKQTTITDNKPNHHIKEAEVIK